MYRDGTLHNDEDGECTGTDNRALYLDIWNVVGQHMIWNVQGRNNTVYIIILSSSQELSQCLFLNSIYLLHSKKLRNHYYHGTIQSLFVTHFVS